MQLLASSQNIFFEKIMIQIKNIVDGSSRLFKFTGL